jgi:hypothetical protein
VIDKETNHRQLKKKQEGIIKEGRKKCLSKDEKEGMERTTIQYKNKIKITAYLKTKPTYYSLNSTL